MKMKKPNLTHTVSALLLAMLFGMAAPQRIAQAGDVAEVDLSIDGDCQILIPKDTTSHLNALRTVMTYFNKSGDVQYCRSSWKVSPSVQRITLVDQGTDDNGKPIPTGIVLTGLPGKAGLVIDGGGVVIDAQNIPAGQCAITIDTHNVTIKHLRITDGKGDGICITDNAHDITFEDVRISSMHGTGISVAQNAHGIIFGRGIRVTDAATAGMVFKGSLAGQRDQLFAQFVDTLDSNNKKIGETPDPDSLSLFSNGNNNANLVTLTNFNFTSLQINNGKIQAQVKDCNTDASCKISSLNEILLYRIGEAQVNSVSVCVNLLKKSPSAASVADQICDKAVNKGALTVAGTTVTGAAVEYRTYDSGCAGKGESAFLECVGANDAALSTNLLGRLTKGGKVGVFTFDTKGLTFSNQDSFFLIPVFASGDVQGVFGSSSCHFIPKQNVTSTKVELVCASDSNTGGGQNFGVTEFPITAASDCTKVVADSFKDECQCFDVATVLASGSDALKQKCEQAHTCFDKSKPLMTSDFKKCIGDTSVTPKPTSTGGSTGGSSGGSSGGIGENGCGVNDIVVNNPDPNIGQYCRSPEYFTQYGVKDVYECNAARAATLGQTNFQYPINADADHDGIPDIAEDRNGNCSWDSNETNWLDPDTDKDGITDGVELGATGRSGYRECYVVVDVDATSGAASIPEALKSYVLSEQTGGVDAKDTYLYPYASGDYFKGAHQVTDPRDGRTYNNAIAYLTIIDPATVGTTQQVVCGKSSQSECTQDGVDGNHVGLFPVGFVPSKRGQAVAGQGFCLGTDPLKPDTDGDGLNDGEEQKPFWYNQSEAYHLWEVQSPTPLMVSDGKGGTIQATCDGAKDTYRAGRYFTTADIVQKTSLTSDIDHDAIDTGLDNCPTIFNPDQEDTDNDGIGDGCQKLPKWDGTFLRHDGFICVSDSLSGSYGDFSGQGDNSRALFDKLITDSNETGKGRTNPFNPDTDGDTLCDGTGCTGPNFDGSSELDASGKETHPVKSEKDVVPFQAAPTVTDANGVTTTLNVRAMQCQPGWVYYQIKNEYRDAVKKSVMNFANLGNLKGTKYDEVYDTVSGFYDAEWQKVRKANGGMKLPDWDGDGIPDVVESPNGNCPDSSTDAYATNPFAADSDFDGLDDEHDPCPNKLFAYDPIYLPKAGAGGTLDTSALNDPNIRQKFEADLLKSAAECGAQGTKKYLDKYALYYFLDFDFDNLKNVEEDYDISGGTPQSSNFETSIFLSDSDQDGLSDYLERSGLAVSVDFGNLSKNIGIVGDVIRTNPIAPDTDGDNLLDGVEVAVDGDATSYHAVFGQAAGVCTNATLHDTNPTRADSDGDGLSDSFELANTASSGQSKQITNPNNPDSDSDGLCDGGADAVGADGKPLTKVDGVTPFCAAGEDKNGDGLTPLGLKPDPKNPKGSPSVLVQGSYKETDPCVADTDGDSKPDKEDECPLINNPTCKQQNQEGFDFDQDGLPDLVENSIIGTDSQRYDSDGDGLADGCDHDDAKNEFIKGRGELCNQLIAGPITSNFIKFRDCGATPYVDCDTDPMDADTDHDGVDDGKERNYPVNPRVADTDGDCMSDGLEDTHFVDTGNVDAASQQHIFVIDPNGGLPDGRFAGCSTVGNGVTVCNEYNANSADTDGDGIPDGNANHSGLREDLDCSGYANKDANGNLIETLVTSSDSDMDGFGDYDEVTAGGRGIADLTRGITNATQIGSHKSSCSLVPDAGDVSRTDTASNALMLIALALPLAWRLRRRMAVN